MILPRYKIRVLPEAEEDLDNIYDNIAFVKFSPMAARKYRDGIIDKIYGLALTGGMFAISNIDSLQREYGKNVRTVRYKKVTIIYTVRENFVVVHSVRPGNTIK